MNRVVGSLPKTCSRHFSGTQKTFTNQKLADFKRRQMEFQANPDVPVYLRKGTSDKILFFTAVGLTAYSFTTALYGLYKVATRK